MTEFELRYLNTTAKVRLKGAGQSMLDELVSSGTATKECVKKEAVIDG